MNRVEDKNNRDESPLVSVVMNCFNGEKYLKRSLESVLAQTYKNFEIVFWDNLSTDDSKNILMSYDDDRINYYCADVHTVLYDARNYAVRKCNGEFITFLDVDDWWAIDKLEKQVSLFKDDEVGLSCGNYILVNERSGGNVEEKKAYESIPSGYVLDDLFKDNFVHMSSLVIRREILVNSEKMFDSRFNIIGDLEILVRLCSRWKMASVQDPITYYRWHDSNTGFKTNFSIGSELELWYSEIKNNDEYLKCDNFNLFKRKVFLYSVLKALYDGKRYDAFVKSKRLTLLQRVKTVLLMLFPVHVTQRILSRK